MFCVEESVGVVSYCSWPTFPAGNSPRCPARKSSLFGHIRNLLFSVCHPGCPVWDNLVLSCFCERVVTRTKWTFAKNLNCFPPNSSLSLLIWDPWLGMMHRGLQLYELFCCYWYWVFIEDLSGADPGFFLGGGALVSCSTSTPINHIVFFFAEY